MYGQWLRRSDVRRRPGRRPSSSCPFERLFGSWTLALHAAGLFSDDVQAFKQDNLICPAKYAYSDEDLLSALRLVRDRLGRVPRSRPYEGERAKVIEESFAAGAPQTLPSYGAFLKRFGGGNEALGAAGMQPYEGRWDMGEFAPPQMTGSYQWSDEELLDIVREACAACRAPPRRWRSTSSGGARRCARRSGAGRRDASRPRRRSTAASAGGRARCAASSRRSREWRRASSCGR